MMYRKTSRCTLVSFHSSLQSSVHPVCGLIYTSLCPVYSLQSGTHREHSWTHLVYSPHAQPKHIWKHLGHSGTHWTYLVYRPRVPPSIQCSTIPGTTCVPPIVCTVEGTLGCTSHVQSMYSSVNSCTSCTIQYTLMYVLCTVQYILVYVQCTAQCTVQCMV